MTAPAAHAPALVPVYTDTSGDELLAGYAGGGVVELLAPGGCVHVRVSEVGDLARRLTDLACGRDPGGP